ncbi:MAG: acetyl-CoA carboxylase biotin carboxyl carrier protein [Proteobacteria bacterium]|nr:acetyl-CoA carboxylase biotin carboxyl carrier protein [Pseudomonadota bacterium]
MVELKQVKELIELLKENNLDEILVEGKDDKIHIKSNVAPKAVPTFAAPQVAPVANHAPTVTPTQDATNTIDETKQIKSPMVGTFYAKPTPESKEFVAIGDSIKKGQALCIIEAMKTMNKIDADKNGIIKQILIKDGQAVEFDEPLFVIE